MIIISSDKSSESWHWSLTSI